jgi:hypothetical protein
MRWACRCCSVVLPCRRTTLMRTVKSRGPDIPTLISTSMVPGITGDGGQKARRTGESAKQPFKPLRGECRVFSAEPVVTAASFFCCWRAMGAASARHSPCPLFRGQSSSKTRARQSRREKATPCPRYQSKPRIRHYPALTYVRQLCASLNPSTSRAFRFESGASCSPSSRVTGTLGQ